MADRYDSMEKSSSEDYRQTKNQRALGSSKEEAPGFLFDYLLLGLSSGSFLKKRLLFFLGCT